VFSWRDRNYVLLIYQIDSRTSGFRGDAPGAPAPPIMGKLEAGLTLPPPVLKKLVSMPRQCLVHRTLAMCRVLKISNLTYYHILGKKRCITL